MQERDITFERFPEADVEKFVIHGMSIGQIRNILGHICDLANKKPFMRERGIDDKLSIVYSPAAIFIPKTAKGAFVRSLKVVMEEQNRFVAISDDEYRLLKSPTCLKIATHLTLCTLQGADIRQVDVMCYGMKSTPRLLIS